MKTLKEFEDAWENATNPREVTTDMGLCFANNYEIGKIRINTEEGDREDSWITLRINERLIARCLIDEIERIE